MTRIGDFAVELRRDGLALSSHGRFATLFDATRAALDLADALGRGAPAAPLHVAVRRGAESFLDIRVVPGKPIDP